MPETDRKRAGLAVEAEERHIREFHRLRFRATNAFAQQLTGSHPPGRVSLAAQETGYHLLGTAAKLRGSSTADWLARRFHFRPLSWLGTKLIVRDDAPTRSARRVLTMEAARLEAAADDHRLILHVTGPLLGGTASTSLLDAFVREVSQHSSPKIIRDSSTGWALHASPALRRRKVIYWQIAITTPSLETMSQRANRSLKVDRFNGAHLRSFAGRHTPKSEAEQRTVTISSTTKVGLRKAEHAFPADVTQLGVKGSARHLELDDETAYEVAWDALSGQIARIVAYQVLDPGTVEADRQIERIRAITQARNRLSPHNRQAVDAVIAMIVLGEGSTAPDIPE